MDDNFSEGAKAAQEIAKTTGKGLDAACEFGGFISRFIAPAAEQLSGIVTDKLRYMRWESQLQLRRRAQRFLEANGLSHPDQTIPLKFLAPLVEHATLEDDEYLRDKWAALLANAGTAATGVQIHPRFIDLLSSLSPLEAKIMDTIYAAVDEWKAAHSSLGYQVFTGNLPDYAIVKDHDDLKDRNARLSVDVKFALTNLVQIGCIEGTDLAGGGYSIMYVRDNIFGSRFLDACKIPGGLK